MELRVLRWIGVMISISLMVVGGCSVINRCIGSVKTVADLASQLNKNDEPTIYLEENGTYEPYLMLTSNYGG